MNNINENIYTKLDSFRDLPYNWDSYAGFPINIKAIEKAKELLALFGDENWQAVPCGTSGLQLELHTKEFDIEIYIEAL